MKFHQPEMKVMFWIICALAKHFRKIPPQGSTIPVPGLGLEELPRGAGCFRELFVAISTDFFQTVKPQKRHVASQNSCQDIAWNNTFPLAVLHTFTTCMGFSTLALRGWLCYYSTGLQHSDSPKKSTKKVLVLLDFAMFHVVIGDRTSWV